MTPQLEGALETLQMDLAGRQHGGQGGRAVNLDALDALVDSVDGMGRPK